MADIDDSFAGVIPMVFLGPSVALRPMSFRDKARVLAWRNADDVRAYMYTDHIISDEEHTRWFDGVWDDATRKYWIIELDGEPVGVGNLYDIDHRNKRCGWAWYLADPAVRGKGVGSAVERQVLDYVFGEMKFNKLWCEVLASNERAWKLHEKFGFTIEARYREHVVKNGERVDVLGLAILASEWQG